MMDGCSKQVPSASFATGQATDVWEGDRLTLLKPSQALAVLQAMYMAWNLSKPASTPAPATPRRMFAPAPFIRDMNPSFLVTWKEAVHGALVLDATAGGHHHPPPHGVNGVGHESSSDSDSPSEEE